MYPDGTFVEYDSEHHVLKIEVAEGGKVELHCLEAIVNGDATIKCHATVKGDVREWRCEGRGH